jgi:hypothetical protein
LEELKMSKTIALVLILVVTLLSFEPISGNADTGFITVTTSATVTVTLYVTITPTTTLQPFDLNNPACQYPMNPNFCNEGPPVTIVGTFFNESGCLTVFGIIASANPTPQQETYVIWFYNQNIHNRRTVPKKIPDNTVVQIYGYVYPDWPQGTPFPPYPFQTTLCGGIPVASIPPYFTTGP